MNGPSGGSGTESTRSAQRTTAQHMYSQQGQQAAPTENGIDFRHTTSGGTAQQQQQQQLHQGGTSNNAPNIRYSLESYCLCIACTYNRFFFKTI